MKFQVLFFLGTTFLSIQTISVEANTLNSTGNGAGLGGKEVVNKDNIKEGDEKVVINVNVDGENIVSNVKEFCKKIANMVTIDGKKVYEKYKESDKKYAGDIDKKDVDNVEGGSKNWLSKIKKTRDRINDLINVDDSTTSDDVKEANKKVVDNVEEGGEKNFFGKIKEVRDRINDLINMDDPKIFDEVKEANKKKAIMEAKEANRKALREGNKEVSHDYKRSREIFVDSVIDFRKKVNELVRMDDKFVCGSVMEANKKAIMEANKKREGDRKVVRDGERKGVREGNRNGVGEGDKKVVDNVGRGGEKNFFSNVKEFGRKIADKVRIDGKAVYDSKYKHEADKKLIRERDGKGVREGDKKVFNNFNVGGKKVVDNVRERAGRIFNNVKQGGSKFFGWFGKRFSCR